MNIPKTAKRLTEFMTMTEREVVDKFLTLDGAMELSYTSKKTPIVFVPGTRDDRVLLVAHYDTVWDSDPIKVVQSGSWLAPPADSNIGIGADDRAGCCALWMLRTLGHSLLLVPDEETGCHGSGHVVKHHLDTIGEHQFMIQFDRKDAQDLVYYGYETDEFEEFIEAAYPSYVRASGSYTDIVELMPAMGIAGVNISIGYHNEHTSSESIDILDFIRTVYLSLNLLNQSDLPAFECGDWGRGVFSPNYDFSDEAEYYGRWGSSISKRFREEEKTDHPTDAEDCPFEDLEYSELENFDVIVCPNCKFIHTDTESDMVMTDPDYAWCGSCGKDFVPKDSAYAFREVPSVMQDDETNTYKVDV